jgi:hypothetical protein
MDVQYVDIVRDFEELRSFVLNDLDQVVGLEKGANYAAAAIIACAHETLARLHSPQVPDYATFGEALPSSWKLVARSLYDALRNGIVHGYATKALIVNGQRLELSISWREHRHLSFDAVGGILYLNVQQMAADLHEAFTRYENVLRADAAARESFQRKRRKAREVHPQGDQKAAWLDVLNA